MARLALILKGRSAGWISLIVILSVLLIIAALSLPMLAERDVERWEAGFDSGRAAGEVERWWSLVLGGNRAAAVGMSHPDADFNFDGLVELNSGAAKVSADQPAFGTEDLPMLCYSVAGDNGSQRGAAVFRRHQGRWLLWEVRPGTIGCVVGER